MRSFFVQNGQVALHVLENGEPSAEIPSLLVVGGLWEPAERAIPLLSGLSSHVIALSLRGRGLSSTPEAGYDLVSHLSDIEAVIRHCRLKNYCVLGFSRGASYALGWTLENQLDMVGLILVDQPPVHSKPGPGYVEFWSNLVYQGVPVLNYMRGAALAGLAREAEHIDFSPRLPELRLPVMLFAGRNKDAAIQSDLADEFLGTYTKAIPDCSVTEFLESGHMIPDEEQQKYVNEVEVFLQQLKN